MVPRTVSCQTCSPIVIHCFRFPCSASQPTPSLPGISAIALPFYDPASGRLPIVHRPLLPHRRPDAGCIPNEKRQASPHRLRSHGLPAMLSTSPSRSHWRQVVRWQAALGSAFIGSAPTAGGSVSQHPMCQRRWHIGISNGCGGHKGDTYEAARRPLCE
jgi:hypothetical protein